MEHVHERERYPSAVIPPKVFCPLFGVACARLGVSAGTLAGILGAERHGKAWREGKRGARATVLARLVYVLELVDSPDVGWYWTPERLAAELAPSVMRGANMAAHPHGLVLGPWPARRPVYAGGGERKPDGPDFEALKKMSPEELKQLPEKVFRDLPDGRKQVLAMVTGSGVRWFYHEHHPMADFPKL